MGRNWGNTLGRKREEIWEKSGRGDGATFERKGQTFGAYVIFGNETIADSKLFPSWKHELFPTPPPQNYTREI